MDKTRTVKTGSVKKPEFRLKLLMVAATLIFGGRNTKKVIYNKSISEVF